VKSVNLLKKLSDAFGVSGFEDEVRKIIKDELKDIAEISYDGIGSIICQKNGGKGPKVMLSAHIDELGLLVQHITDSGKIKFIPIGSWSPQVIYGQKFLIRSKKGLFPAVISTLPVHFWLHDKEKLVAVEDMTLDCGAKSYDDAVEKFGIEPGDPIVPDVKFQEISDGEYLLGKGFDDRAGCALMIECLKTLKDVDLPNVLYGVGTCQEEIGIRGAYTTARIINPDVCIILEGSPADDAMPIKPEAVQGGLGKGCQIRYYDPSMIANPKLGNLMKKICKEHKIPYQIAIRTGGATDGAVIHKSNFGVPSIVLGTPVRYAHAPYGMISIADFKNNVKLLSELIKRLDAKTVKSLTEC
jgi:putative aminopeptidase FrvX